MTQSHDENVEQNAGRMFAVIDRRCRRMLPVIRQNILDDFSATSSDNAATCAWQFMVARGWLEVQSLNDTGKRLYRITARGYADMGIQPPIWITPLAVQPHQPAIAGLRP